MYKTKCCNSLDYQFKRQMAGVNEHYKIICKRCHKQYFIERSVDNYIKHKDKEISVEKVSEEKLNNFFEI